MNHGATPNESAVEVGSTSPMVSLRALASRRAELSGSQPRAPLPRRCGLGSSPTRLGGR